MNIDVFWTIEERDIHGQLKDFRKWKARSWIRGFVDILYTQMAQTGAASLFTDTGGTARTQAENANNFGMDAPANTNTNGIVVGTGTNAVAIGDTALQTIIAHGTGSGQLQYGAMSFTVPQTVSTTRKFTAVRSFTNGSGAGINVTEIGMYAQIGNTPWYIAIERTLSSFTVNNGATKTVTATIQVAV